MLATLVDCILVADAVSLLVAKMDFADTRECSLTGDEWGGAHAATILFGVISDPNTRLLSSF